MKAQSSIEASLIISFMMFVLVAFVAVVLKRGEYLKYKENEDAIQRLAELIKREIEFADHVETGYTRNFTLPSNFAGLRYNITLINSTMLNANYSELVVTALNTSKSIAAVELLPKNVTGNICSGYNYKNIIKKLSDRVEISCVLVS